MSAPALSARWTFPIASLAFALASMTPVPARALGTAQDVSLVAATGVGVAVAGPTVIGGAVVAVVGGTGELMTGILCAWWDPADTANFAQRAEPDLLAANFGSDSSASAALSAAAGSFVDAASAVVRSAKGVQMSLDRLAGAQAVGTATDVAHQTQWLGEWRLRLYNDAKQAIGRLSAFNTLLVAEAPATAALQVTTSMMKQVRSDEGVGIFDPVEQQLLTQWQFSPLQTQQFSTYIGHIGDAAIDAAGPMAVSQALASTGRLCESCLLQASQVPEPGSAGLLLGGLALLVPAWRSARSGQKATQA